MHLASGIWHLAVARTQADEQAEGRFEICVGATGTATHEWGPKAWCSWDIWDQVVSCWDGRMGSQGACTHSTGSTQHTMLNGHGHGQ